MFGNWLRKAEKRKPRHDRRGFFVQGRTQAVCDTRTVKVCVTPGVIGTVTDPLTVEPSGAVVAAVTVIEVAVSVAGTVTTTESESAAGARVALVSSEDHAKVEPAGSGIAVPLSSSSAVKVPVEPALIAIVELLTVTEK